MSDIGLLGKRKGSPVAARPRISTRGVSLHPHPGPTGSADTAARAGTWDLPHEPRRRHDSRDATCAGRPRTTANAREFRLRSLQPITLLLDQSAGSFWDLSAEAARAPLRSPWGRVDASNGRCGFWKALSSARESLETEGGVGRSMPTHSEGGIHGTEPMGISGQIGPPAKSSSPLP